MAAAATYNDGEVKHKFYSIKLEQESCSDNSDQSDIELGEVFTIKEEPEFCTTDSDCADLEPVSSALTSLKGTLPQSKTNSKAVKNTPKDKYSCDIKNCDFISQWVNPMYQHFFQVHKQKRFPCKEEGCKSKFASPCWMNRHSRKFHNGKTYDAPFPCSEPGCSSSFWVSSFLEEHIRRNHNPLANDSDAEAEPVEVILCGFKGLGPKGVQMKVNGRLTCQFDGCSLKTTDAQTLFIHYSSDHNHKAFLCPEPDCGRRLCLPAELKRHIIRMHKAKKTRKRFLCEVPDCGGKFATQHYLNKHVRLVHEKRFVRVCDQCGRECTDPYSLKQHKRRHQFDGSHPTPEGTLRADSNESDSEYEPLVKKRRSSKLKNDRRDETLPFPCEVKGCGRSFRYECRLRTHTEEAHSGKKFRCPHKGCQKTFNCQRNLDSHIKFVHVREADRTCEKCSKVVTIGNFDHHMKLHREGKFLGDVVVIDKQTGKTGLVCGRNCKFIAEGLEELVQHRELVHGQKSLFCKVKGCSHMFASEAGLKRHGECFHKS